MDGVGVPYFPQSGYGRNSGEEKGPVGDGPQVAKDVPDGGPGPVSRDRIEGVNGGQVQGPGSVWPGAP